MAKTKAQRFKEVHSQALEEFDNIQSIVSDERQQAVEDRRFYSIAGAQWEGNLGKQFENRPMLEVNKVHLSVLRIINEYRNNRITVNFTSKDGEDDDLSDVCDSLYRADENESTADEAYDNAFEEAVGGGYGAWRLRAIYEDEYDEENEYQRIAIEPIYDADSSVFWDPNAKRQDKSDAKYCFVLTAMSIDAYEDKYDDEVSSWPEEIKNTEYDWATPDVVYVAEYYVIEDAYQTLHFFKTLDGEEEKYTDDDFKNDDELEDKLYAIGSRETGSRKIKTRKVHKYIMSGGKVLEDCGYIAGKNIPIVQMYGKRWFVDNIERAMGHVRLAKDSQRLKNMQLSKLAEFSSLSSLEKPIFHPEQIAGHQNMWEEDNINNYPYMLVNKLTDKDGIEMPGGPVDYTRSPNIPPAMAALLQLTEQDMRDILGDQAAAERIVSNVSGEAITQVKENLDMQTYIYMSNMSKAMKRSGEIWLSMANDVYIEDLRKMKTIDPTGKTSSITLMSPYLKENGEQAYDNDLSNAKFDVNVDVGPSSSTRRKATVRTLTEMLMAMSDPQDMKVISSMIMMNMEGEGIGDVRDYYRMQLVRMGVIEPNEEEQQKLMEEAQAAQQQPDPQAMYLMAEAKNAEAKAMEAQAKTAKTIAETEKTQAETVETLASVDRDDRKAAVDAAEKISNIINK